MNGKLEMRRRWWFRRAWLLLLVLTTLYAGCSKRHELRYRLPAGQTEADRVANLAPDQPFSFVVYGDSRPGSLHRRLLKAIAAEKPDFVLHTGDLVSKGRDWNQWLTFDADTWRFRQEFPFFPAMGNHDRGTGFVKVFTMPYADTAGVYYSFRAGNAKFVMLNSSYYELLKPGSPELNWLENELADTTVTHIFVAFHHPPFSPNPKRDSVNTRITRSFLPLLVEHAGQVRCVFNGHDHFYYRTRRNGVTFLTTGGGGARLYRVDPKRTKPGDHWAEAHHYVRVDVDGRRVRLQAKTLDGEVVDSFELSAASP